MGGENLIYFFFPHCYHPRLEWELLMSEFWADSHLGCPGGAWLGCRATPESRNPSAGIRLGAWGSTSPGQCWHCQPSHGPRETKFCRSIPPPALHAQPIFPYGCCKHRGRTHEDCCWRLSSRLLLGGNKKKKLTKCFPKLCLKASQLPVL